MLRDFVLAVVDLLAVIYYTTYIATKGKIMQNPFVLYEAYETNADFELLKLVHQGFSRDIAESKMGKLYAQSGGLADYILITHPRNEMVSYCLSARTTMLRNECQG
jgi:hypothetical protein